MPPTRVARRCARADEQYLARIGPILDAAGGDVTTDLIAVGAALDERLKAKLTDEGEQRVTDERGWLRRLATACWKYRSLVLLAFGASLLGMTIQAIVPLIQRAIVDDSIITHTRSIWPLAIVLSCSR